MLLLKVYLSIFLFFSINTFPQVNFHLTHFNDQTLTHDCLRYLISSIGEKDSQEILSFCLTEKEKPLLKSNILDQKLTFNELQQQNITIEQLYHWSTSIDLIEQYQFYLISNQSSMSNNVFYNCSIPRFGSQCQYEFLYFPLENFTLKDMISQFYKIQYTPTSLTCYIHLECNRGSKSTCIDWTEICDGYVHCVDNHIDEKFCWQLLINECKEDEYRCRNGQCISKEFAFDEIEIYECFDRSDSTGSLELISERFNYEPTINHEDIACMKPDENSIMWLQISRSCDKTRRALLKQFMISTTPATLSNMCSFAFYCTYYYEIHHYLICQDICEYKRCIVLIDETCPDIIIVPSVPLVFGHIHIDTSIKFRSIHGRSTSTLEELMKSLIKYLKSCNTISYENMNICASSFMYRCKNSTKCISIYDLCNNIIDCDYHDDEDCRLINGSCLPIETDVLFKCPSNNICISLNRFGDGTCDCPYEYMTGCEDETMNSCQTNHISTCNEYERIGIIRKMITFSTICDDFGIVFNGADEVDCYKNSFINCPLYHHICIKPETFELICLPLEKANDGHIDCLGALDEPLICRSKTYEQDSYNFYCDVINDEQCTYIDVACHIKCLEKNQNTFCNLTDNLNYLSYCSDKNFLNESSYYDYLCTIPNRKSKVQLGYFVLNELLTEKSELEISKPDPIEQTFSYNFECHRGYPLRLHSNQNQQIVCLCPSSYYGDFCQYQNN